MVFFLIFVVGAIGTPLLIVYNQVDSLLLVGFNIVI